MYISVVVWLLAAWDITWYLTDRSDLYVSLSLSCRVSYVSYFHVFELSYNSCVSKPPSSVVFSYSRSATWIRRAYLFPLILLNIAHIFAYCLTSEASCLSSNRVCGILTLSHASYLTTLCRYPFLGDGSPSDILTKIFLRWCVDSAILCCLYEFSKYLLGHLLLTTRFPLTVYLCVGSSAL